MEKHEKQKRNDPLLQVSDSTLNSEALPEAQVKCISGDGLPKKRPRRLSVSCTERDVKESLAPFESSNALTINACVTSISNEEGSDECMLECICEKTSQKYCVKLQGIWASTPVRIGSSLRIIGAEARNEKELMLNWETGVIVLEQNILVPCTMIARATFCRRKAVLSYHFRNRIASNNNILVGNIVHELFQIAVTRPNFDVTESSLIDLWRKELHWRYAEQLFVLSISLEEIESKLYRYLKTITHWILTHMPPTKGRNNCLPTGLMLEEVVDIEESIWCSCYGFTAKLDCTLKVKAQNGERKLIPMELKSGKSNPNIEHTTQVMLYCLALTAKGSTIESGLLLYLLDETVRVVSPKLIDLKGILHLRNEIASSISAFSLNSLPEPLADTRACNGCDYLLPCSLLQQPTDDSVAEKFFKNQLKHLEIEHIDYFKKFSRWVLLDWSCISRKGNADKKNSGKRMKLEQCIKGLLNSMREVENKTVLTFQRLFFVFYIFENGNSFLL
ncbi:unnamed protein product [Thelazia callipaeda]|uniref:DNA replication ATP-dependent helicase/nuclease DNA2 n=1 Tax=Thelazia callipaeda TaxID=103827 RepID=A0A0N5D152_THECL|nr:unnamed protein product [Thelazia callipaeda]